MSCMIRLQSDLVTDILAEGIIEILKKSHTTMVIII